MGDLRDITAEETSCRPQDSNSHIMARFFVGVVSCLSVLRGYLVQLLVLLRFLSIVQRSKVVQRSE